MRKQILILSLLFFVFSCQKKVETTTVETKSSKDSISCKPKSTKFEMYKMSEMAGLMEQMYVQNQELKKRIQNGGTAGKFPEYFNRIFTAKFTDDTDNDAFFKEKASAYIKAQKLIYSDATNLKEHYNEGIDACIKCHENKCGGPIPKIKKLYIE